MSVLNSDINDYYEIIILFWIISSASIIEHNKSFTILSSDHHHGAFIWIYLNIDHITMQHAVLTALLFFGYGRWTREYHLFSYVTYSKKIIRGHNRKKKLEQLWKLFDIQLGNEHDILLTCNDLLIVIFSCSCMFNTLSYPQRSDKAKKRKSRKFKNGFFKNERRFKSWHRSIWWCNFSNFCCLLEMDPHSGTCCKKCW